MNLISSQPTHCPSCEEKFEGPFCYACGERQASGEDYTLKKYVLQAVDMFTHFDGKFFRTIKYLLFFPGKLTEENFEGRKVKLMKPVQLFVLISLVYFFLMKNVDVFVSFLKNQKYASPLYLEAKSRAALQHVPLTEYLQHYDQVLANISKTFIFILVPLISIGVWGLFFRKSKNFVPHAVFVTHFFSFFLAFTLIYFEVFLNSWIDPGSLTIGQKALGISIEVFVLLIYMLLALKRVYKQRWTTTAFKTLALFCWMFAMMGLYNLGIGWLNFLFL